MSLTFRWAAPDDRPPATPGTTSASTSRTPAGPRELRLRIGSASAAGGAAPGLLLGTDDEVAERISEYADLGIDRFVLEADDPVRERERFSNGVVPALERRGLLARETPAGTRSTGAGSR